MVGVCVAAYNRDQYLRECLDSLLAQDFEDFKIYVTSDGSTDGTQGVVKEYAKKHPVVDLGNNGTANVGTSKNRCVQAAIDDGCDAIQMLDSDDRAHPDLVSKMYRFLFSGDYDWVNCHGDSFGGRFTRLTSWPNKTYEDMLDTDYLTSWGIFKADTLRAENYREGLAHLDDWELYIRLLKNGYRYGVLNESLVDYRVHDNQLSKLKAGEKGDYHQRILEMNEKKP